MMKRKDILILSTMNKVFWDLPIPSSITYMWNFGSMLGITLMIQILSGLFLTFHYCSFSEESFNSIFMIMKEIWNGWIMRFMHMNGASMFFLFIYLHLIRGLFYLSSANKKTWNSGVLIFLILMMISFMGYVLPWGQMSYWAVAVITNLLTIIPFIGNVLVEWIWGGFSVGKPTLSRFYSMHFIMPMILTVLVLIHLIFLHEKGSSNPLGLKSNMDKIMFNPYFMMKDYMFILFVIFLLLILALIFPYLTLDPENNIPANPMKTPIHIQPEWYFLPFYAILRSVPSKMIGVMLMLSSILILLLLTLYKMKFSLKFSKSRYLLFFIFLSSLLNLMILGSFPAEEPYVMMSLFWTSIYFTSLLILNL